MVCWTIESQLIKEPWTICHLLKVVQKDWWCLSCFYKTPEVASEPAHNWPVNRYLYVRAGKAGESTISVQHVRLCVSVSVSVSVSVCVCVCVLCVYLCYSLKLRHLLPSTSIPSVEMGFEQTNKSAENELSQLQKHLKYKKVETHMWFLHIPAYFLLQKVLKICQMLNNQGKSFSTNLYWIHNNWLWSAFILNLA